MTRDVVIVGAGPAGSAAAAALARRGRTALLLDRESFPRDKACGDGVPPGTIGLLNGIGMDDALREARFTPVRGIRLVSPRGHDWSASLAPRRPGTDFVIAPRFAFDDLIRRHAVACGAEFMRGRVRTLMRDAGRVGGVVAEVDGAETSIPARIVIGADGATSAVARSLGVAKPAPHNRAVALRAYVEGIETIPRTIELHWYSRCAPGYAWVFPLGEATANVGVIVRADWFKRRGVPLDALLDEFLRAPDVRPRLAAGAVVRDVATWQLPYAVPRAAPRSFDGAMLVGDAGRFVDALTGEGIHHAVASALIAADVADAALSSGDTSKAALLAFDIRCEAELGSLVRRAYRIQERLAVHPWGVEAVFLASRSLRGALIRWLNKRSTDFIVGPGRVG